MGRLLDPCGPTLFAKTAIQVNIPERSCRVNACVGYLNRTTHIQKRIAGEVEHLVFRKSKIRLVRQFAVWQITDRQNLDGDYAPHTRMKPWSASVWFVTLTAWPCHEKGAR